jgi:hypothetical protein
LRITNHGDEVFDYILSGLLRNAQNFSVVLHPEIDVAENRLRKEQTVA